VVEVSFISLDLGHHTPWCWPPMDTRLFIGGYGHRWATARLQPTYT